MSEDTGEHLNSREVAELLQKVLNIGISQAYLMVGRLCEHLEQPRFSLPGRRGLFVHAAVVAQIRAWEAEAKELGISPEAMSKWMSVRMYARQGQTSVLMQQRQDAETALRRTLDEAQQGLLDLLLSTYAAPAVSPETGTAPGEYRSTRKELRDIRQRLLALEEKQRPEHRVTREAGDRAIAFLNTPPCRGQCSPEQLLAHLKPHYGMGIAQEALDQLCDTGQLSRTENGDYRVNEAVTHPRPEGRGIEPNG